ILVDGVDVREWDLTELRREIGVVQQAVFLFSGGPLDNTPLRRTQPGRRQSLVRTAPVALVRARLRLRPEDPRDGRGDLERRQRNRTPDSACAERAAHRPHRADHRASPVHHRTLRPHPRTQQRRTARERNSSGVARPAWPLFQAFRAPVHQGGGAGNPGRRLIRGTGTLRSDSGQAPGGATKRQTDSRQTDSRQIDSKVERSSLVSCARRASFAVAIASLCAGLAGCELGYLAHAAYEQGRLLWNRRPIAQELARPELDPLLRDKFEMVIKLRRFAADRLGLNVGNAYRTVTEVDQGAIVWVVMAAPKDSLTPYTWWFPIVGAVPYRGYFDVADANAEAAEFEQDGFDTLVRPAVAFSSLGFFSDPVLSNLLKLDRVQLAGVIFHELFHRTFYLASDAMFDESAATFVGGAAAVEFFTATEGTGS